SQCFSNEFYLNREEKLYFFTKYYEILERKMEASTKAKYSKFLVSKTKEYLKFCLKSEKKYDTSKKISFLHFVTLFVNSAKNNGIKQFIANFYKNSPSNSDFRSCIDAFIKSGSASIVQDKILYSVGTEDE